MGIGVGGGADVAVGGATVGDGTATGVEVAVGAIGMKVGGVAVGTDLPPDKLHAKLITTHKAI